ncbi:MAG: SUMF1/EgtB/PvdO family nonheme iron enzyme, partial [Planctomycetota bacterium]
MTIPRCGAALWLLALHGIAASAGQPAIGFLVTGRAVAKLGKEGRAARALAHRAHGARVVAVGKDASFTDEDGQPLALDRFDALWFHQGDDADWAGQQFDAKTLAALRGYVSDGGGLYLSGAALAMVHALGVEPARPRLGGPGNDRGRGGLTPAVAKHPVFEGLAFAGGHVPITDRGYPAFSDFHGSGGPSKGMVLAHAAPNAGERPMAEWALGKGRIIAMGWRLPHYSHRPNPHGANLERLTANILAYLATPKSWQKIVAKPPPRRKRKPAGKPYVQPGLTDHAVESLELAIRHLARHFGDRYSQGDAFLARLEAIQTTRATLLKTGYEGKERWSKLETKFRALRREALLANPLLDFDRLLLVRRSAGKLGLPANWQSNSSLPRGGFDNEIAVLDHIKGQANLTSVYRPANGSFVGDVDLHWDAGRVLFSAIGSHRRWRIFEMPLDDPQPRELPLINEPDVDNYDACYLPDGRILFTSTAPFVGVPCVKGSSHVSNLYRYEPDTGAIRRLTFEQDHDWCPTVLPTGRVLYLRWEYSDIPHYVSRILFHMNPDGTEQMEYYGSNSYWPNATFFARPCPGHPTRFVGIVGGHHDVRRMGELVLFDVAQGRHEADGVVQRIPGRGKAVEPIIRDGLVRGSWPKFLHPWPLSDAFVLVACKPTPQSRWGLYLADVFDNLLLLEEDPAYALLEPIPLEPLARPPVIVDKAKPGKKHATVYMADVYQGPGLAGVPRGTVRRLRLFTYQFAYHGMGGQVNRVGLDGPWDVKRIVGTVPIEPDGSAYFRVPANTPLAVQPLDADGRALQLMRSWMTAMPGEVLSCVGCHERQNTTVPNTDTAALRKPPAEIQPFYGPTRSFSFLREVQPVLVAHCVRCHDGEPRQDGKTLPDFTDRPPVPAQCKAGAYRNGSTFPPAYIALRSYVRTPSIESDIHLLTPCEYHAGTTKLVQLLEKGHHGVRLDREGRDRLVTWIDLGAPAHGTWHEIVGMAKVARQRDRRREMDRRYANLDEDPEAVYPVSYKPQSTSPAGADAEGRPQSAVADPPCPGWPFDRAEARRRQQALGRVRRTVALGGGVTLELMRVPGGAFLVGSADGPADERPRRVKVESFWMGRCEVTNAQFARFDPAHDSRVESGDFLQFSVRERGYPMNAAEQPVVRVSWHQAAAFCRRLSEQTGDTFS